MSRDELIGLIAADAKFIDERDAITEYVREPQGRRRAGRGGDPRGLRAVQGGAARARAGGHRRHSTECLPRRFRRSWTTSSRRRSSTANNSPSCSPRWTWAGGPSAEGAGADGAISSRC